MANALNYIVELDFGIKYWLVYLRNEISTKGNFTTENINHAFENLFKTDLSDLQTNTSVVQSTKVRQSLFKLHKNQNVGGLLNDREINFSPIFTAIYGKNGTGKTTFYKVLKDAFYGEQDIRGNIYSEDTTTPNAEIVLTQIEQHKTLQRKGIAYSQQDDTTIAWQKGNTTKDNAIKFCDEQILKASLVQKDTNWDIDKFKLNAFERFQQATRAVESKINEKITKLNSDKTAGTNQIKSLLSNEHLIKKPDFNSEEIANWLQFEGNILVENHAELVEQYEREQATTVGDIEGKRQNLNNENNEIDKVLKSLDNLLSIISQKDALNSSIQKINEIKAKRDVSKFEQFSLIFSPNDVKNQDKFLDLIKKIAETAVTYQYQNYPNGIDKCFYCNQDLKEDSKDLIQEIHKLIDNEFEAELNQNETVLTNIKNQSFIPYELPESWHEIFKEMSGDIKLILSSDILNQYKECATNLIEYIIDNIDLEIKIERLQQYFKGKKGANSVKITDLTTQINGIEEIKRDARVKLQQLKDAEIIVNNQSIIIEVITLQKEISKYESEKDLQGVRTKITQKTRKCQDELITDEFIQKFKNYLSRFNFTQKDKIQRNIAVAHGKSSMSAELKGSTRQHDAKDILSEGEAKVHALCDWLAELSINETTTLILDDPITSLDHRHIDSFITIICELVQQYQVIVFTHNQEFHHKLISNTLGRAAIKKGKCQVCATLPEKNQCVGLGQSIQEIFKCGNYYTIESIATPNGIKKEIQDFRLSYEQRIERIKEQVNNADTNGLGQNIRQMINTFFEFHMLADIKTDVFAGQELIYKWRDIKKDIDNSHYETLINLHNKLSGVSVHIPSLENKTELDIDDFIVIFNSVVDIVNTLTQKSISRF